MAKTIVNARQSSGNKDVQIQTMATLSSSIAHELKNYLGTINIYADLSKNNVAAINKTVKAADYLIVYQSFCKLST